MYELELWFGKWCVAACPLSYMRLYGSHFIPGCVRLQYPFFALESAYLETEMTYLNPEKCVRRECLIQYVDCASFAGCQQPQILIIVSNFHIYSL